ncbi:hypothetical protein [Microbacterium sp.]|uniref:hypothetical protein n=1 Tax=Microbacterium sp. TaxID=51671 RepID=UPI003C768CFA
MTDAVPQKRPAYEPPGRLLSPTGYDPQMRRPATIVAGVVLVLLRVIAGAILLLAVAVGWDELVKDAGATLEGFDPSPEGRTAALGVVLATGVAVLVADVLLAFFVLLGRNAARVIVMIFSTLSIASSFVAWWVQGQEITLQGTFLSLSLDILILLALSSRSAAAYARRRERR